MRIEELHNGWRSVVLSAVRLNEENLAEAVTPYFSLASVGTVAELMTLSQGQ